MRTSLRLLATVKSKHLTTGAPTGLTGLNTHPSPRSTLLYLYSSTLNTLSKFPEHSIYRQATEALTKSRKSIIDAVKPEGYEAWLERSRKKMEQDPEKFGKAENISIADVAGEKFVSFKEDDEVERNWDDEKGRATVEGARSQEDKAPNAKAILRHTKQTQIKVDWEPEPSLTADQIDELEQKIGAGLIEEVVQVAEGELKLANVMLENKVWEELVEKPVPGQWEYFARDTHTPQAQAPPK